VISARRPIGTVPALRLDAFSSAIAPAGDSDMAWTIGDVGFQMRLSSYVPEIIQTNVGAAIQPILEKGQLTQEQVTHWAVHPGGRAILDRVERGLGLSNTALAASRDVLRGCGNMSSATILFVLREILTRGVAPDDTLLAMSFGPGLTIETALLTAV
jgi:predicted naringenin-chalcone synthase